MAGACSAVCQDLCPGQFQVSGEDCTCTEGSGACASEASFTVSSLSQYDMLVLPAAFGETGVTWSVAFSSEITTFEFTLPNGNSVEQAAQQSLITSLETQAADMSSLIESKLIVPDDLVSTSCTNTPSVSITIPQGSLHRRCLPSDSLHLGTRVYSSQQPGRCQLCA